MMRTLNIITPVKSDIPGYGNDGTVQEPRAGELQMRRTKGGRSKLWTYPLDTRKYGPIWKQFINLYEKNSP